MHSDPAEITYDVVLQPGEPLTLPEEAAKVIGPGHWVVSIRPAERDTRNMPIRNHSAFLNGYSAEDEGLYDDYPAR
jgi:hypothetical protein